MQMYKNKYRILLLLTIVSLLGACGGGTDFDQEVAVIVALTQTAAPEADTAATQTAVPVQSFGDFKPLDESECSILYGAISEATGVDGTITSPVPFEDYANDKQGLGCSIELVGHGSQYSDMGTTARTYLENNDWLEDDRYAAAGAGGIAGAYVKDELLCLYSISVGPAEGACSDDEPFFECMNRLTPEQRRHGFNLNCAQPVQ